MSLIHEVCHGQFFRLVNNALYLKTHLTAPAGTVAHLEKEYLWQLKPELIFYFYPIIKS